MVNEQAGTKDHPKKHEAGGVLQAALEGDEAAGDGQNELMGFEDLLPDPGICGGQWNLYFVFGRLLPGEWDGKDKVTGGNQLLGPAETDQLPKDGREKDRHLF